MEKFLFIHPQDETTEFLSMIYKNISDSYKTVIRDPNISDSKIKKLLKEHNNIILLGHGCPSGLLCNTNKKHRFDRLLINSKHVEFLRNKNVIGIWCYANEFFDKYHINGFATGMFVSDIDEALSYNLPLSIVDINESNTLLSTLLSESFFNDKEFIYNYLTNGFKHNAKNLIAQFNCSNFKCF